jgi:hypothetical protein
MERQEEPVFTLEECQILMKALKIVESDFYEMIEIPDFIGYGIGGAHITPKISVAAQKTCYFTTFENSYAFETEVEEHTILSDICSSLVYHKNGGN